MKKSQQAGSAALVPQLAPSTIGLDLGDRWSRYCVVDENALTGLQSALQPSRRLGLPAALLDQPDRPELRFSSA